MPYSQQITVWNPGIPGRTFPQICSLGRDTATSASYEWRGSRRHADAGFQVFQYTLEGCGAVRVREQVYPVPKGNGFLCNLFDPDITYYYPRQETSPWSFVYLVLGGTDSWVRELNARFGYIFPLARTGGCVSQALTLLKGPVLIRSFSASLQLQLIGTLFTELFQACEKGNLFNPGGTLIDKALAFIHDHIESTISTSDIARALGISTEHLCRIFRSRMHVSPLAYVQKQKIRLACGLLMNPAITIKEIAARIRIENVSNFTRFFKHHVGLTPAQFRNQGFPPRKDRTQDTIIERTEPGMQVTSLKPDRHRQKRRNGG